MRRKKSSANNKKRKPNTFLSLLVVGILAVAIGIPATLGLYEKSSSQGEVAAAIDTAYAPVTSLTLLQVDRASGSPTTYCPNNTFAPVYKVKCWNNTEATKTMNSTSCQSPTAIAQHALAYCESIRPTSIPQPTTGGILKPPVPCKVSGAGDVNLDGYVTKDDYLLVEQFASGKVPTAIQKLRADLNGSKTISSSDIALMNSYLLRKITTFPICGTITPTPTYAPSNPWKTPTPTLTNPWGATLTPTTSACAKYGSNYASYCSGTQLREKYSNGSCGMNDNLVTNCANGCTTVTSTSAKCN